ncbi:hypothetical protein BGZ94_001336 [Podila epigama]|nr:hypothetical protein BGZ94_001336 [Podila epigama]
MSKNGHFIKNMVMQTVNRVDEYLQHCSNIERLYLAFSPRTVAQYNDSTRRNEDPTFVDNTDYDDGVAVRSIVQDPQVLERFWASLTQLVLKNSKLKEIYFCPYSVAPSASFLQAVAMQKSINNSDSVNSYRTFNMIAFHRQEFDRMQTRWLSVLLTRVKHFLLFETQHMSGQGNVLASPGPDGAEAEAEALLFPVTKMIKIARVSGMMARDQLQWISQMPALTSLEFALEDTQNVPEIIGTFCQTLKNIVHLEELFFTATPARSLSHTQQVQVIEAPIKPIKKLCLEGFDFGIVPVAIQEEHLHQQLHQQSHSGTSDNPRMRLLGMTTFDRILDRFALTLTSLDLSRCFRVTSKHAQQVLTSCPHLEYCSLLALHISEVLPRHNLNNDNDNDNDTADDQGQEYMDIVSGSYGEGKDWVVSKLKALSIYIYGLENEPPAVHQKIFARLGKLVHLQTLIIGNTGSLRYQEGDDGHDGNHRGGWRNDGLDCRLSSGLNQLEGLRDMREFSMAGLHQFLSVEDVQWMTKHWRKLEEVGGRLNIDDAGPLIDILESADVKVKEYWSQRFEKEPTFEWLLSWTVLEPLLKSLDILPPVTSTTTTTTTTTTGEVATSKTEKSSLKILNLGCGNSELPLDLYHAGYPLVTSVDFVGHVVERMKERCEQTIGWSDSQECGPCPLTFLEMDCLDMSRLGSESFGLCIDKSTSDAISCGDDENCTKLRTLCREVGRVIPKDGLWCVISYSRFRQYEWQDGFGAGLWITEKIEPIQVQASAAQADDDNGVANNVVHTPDVFFYLYVNRRTSVGVSPSSSIK